MSLKTDHELATNLEFRNRLRMALSKTAITVMQDNANPDFAKRARLVTEFMRNPEDWTTRISYFVAAVPQVAQAGVAVTDAVLLQIIAQMWTVFSERI